MIKVGDRFFPVEQAPRIKPVEKIGKIKDRKKDKENNKNKTDALSMEEFLKAIEK